MPVPLKRTVEKRRARDLKARPQVRRTFPAEEILRNLARSVLTRQLHPLIIMPGDIILDGEGRWRGMMLESPDFEFDVICVDRELTPSEIGELQLISAMHSTALNPFDQSVAIRDWLAQNAGSTAKELAIKIDLGQAMISKLNSLWGTIPSVIKAAEEGKIGPSAWYQMSLLPQSEQNGLLQMHLSGLPSAQIAEAVRKARQPAKPASTVKLSRIRLPLPTGCVVLVTGEEMDGDGLVDALSSALEAAKKGNKEGIDVKTLSRVLADKAKG
ncbi:ParB/RepB/Spo0J family partition protein [Zavarzinella formosa]|uniref:ParB/RepB/Spo0J family partition protein n=1 Tax=Zavarzinella formosa TaxID=360055 RepID=UPI0002EACFFB|nr:ParB/RepB/Spo0J family partition protein [Zavarzinella formosa]